MLQPHFKCSAATCGQGLQISQGAPELLVPATGHFHPTRGFSLLQKFPLAAQSGTRPSPTLCLHLHLASQRHSGKSLHRERNGSSLRNEGQQVTVPALEAYTQLCHLLGVQPQATSVTCELLSCLVHIMGVQVCSLPFLQLFSTE